MSRRLARTVPAVASALLLLAATGCGSTATDSTRHAGHAGQAADGTEPRLTVLAAASLTEPFTVLADRFERAHPGVEVAISFDSSATIAAQVVAGAPADVVATADERTMATLSDAGVLAGEPAIFARNELVLVVPPDNPAAIETAADLQEADYVVCAPAVPCGDLARDVLDEHGVTARPRSQEVDVKAVLSKVVLGEADAGLVYASDVVAAGGDVREVPLSPTVATDYPIAVTSDAALPRLAEQWVAQVRSAKGREVLAAAGFADTSGSPR